MEIGRSSWVYSAYSRVRSMPRTSPSELTISVTRRPQPPWRLTRRRKAVSVIPAIGAMANGDGRETEPIFMQIEDGDYRRRWPAQDRSTRAGRRRLGRAGPEFGQLHAG